MRDSLLSNKTSIFSKETLKTQPGFLAFPIMRLWHLVPVLFLLFSGCFGKNSKTETIKEQAAENDLAAQERTLKDLAARSKAAQIAAQLDDNLLASQVIISGIDGKGQLTRDMKMLLTESPAGGIMLFRYNVDTDNDAIQNLIAETSALIASQNNIPPFMAIDHEGGAVNRLRAGVADMPPAASYGEMAHNSSRESVLARIITDSFYAGKAMNALGITMNLAPVAEYINDDNRNFLEHRSYGSDPVFAAEAAAAFMSGMELAGVLCVVKHFPGSAGADPHRFPSVLKGDKAALAELVSPIAALIRDGQAQAIMVSHSAVPAMDTKIASLSPLIMGEWLRQELGFNGIIICDDFSMASAGGAEAANQLKPETAAVLSLAAGADMVLVWPPDLRRTHRAILAALDSGDLSRQRLKDAAERIIWIKMQMGLIHGE